MPEPIQAQVFFENNRSDSPVVVNLWTVPRVGDRIAEDCKEECWEVLSVQHHGWKAYLKGQTWETPPTPEAHLTLKVREINGSRELEIS